MSRPGAKIEEIEDDGASRFTEVEDEFDDDMDFELPELPSGNDTINPNGIKYVEDTAQFKSWSCLYPIYFDATKTVRQGRKVGMTSAVQNPLAKAIADAGKVIGFSVVFEPQKCHPADWSNPGRVRIQIKEESGRWAHPSIRTKSHLYAAISTYLRQNPTTTSDPHKVPVPGMEGSTPKRAAVPKGMHINEILPLHSPALAGQGMNSDGLSSMMSSMFPGMGAMLNDDEPAPPQPQVAAPPKKPKMKRQIIR